MNNEEEREIQHEIAKIISELVALGLPLPKYIFVARMDYQRDSGADQIDDEMQRAIQAHLKKRATNDHP